MHRSTAIHLAAFLLIGFAAVETVSPARAGSTATRCDAHGCVHIHCNSTGDRCYRYVDGPAVRIHHYPTFQATGRNMHRVCDDDGDRCYFSRGRRWDFRAYYRTLGYRWNDDIP